MKEIRESGNQDTEVRLKLESLFDFINEECSELRRLAQLNTEETIARIKISYEIDVNEENINEASELSKKINQINQFNLEMISEINDYETNLKSALLDVKNVMNEARSRELFLNFMNKNCNGKEIRQSKFNTIYFLLKNVNKELNCGIKHFDETNYEDWHLSFENNKNQSDLNAFNRYSLGHLLKTSSVDLLKFNRISTLDLIDKQKKSIKIIIEVLSNNKILISNESFSSTEISLFDANSRKLIDNLSLKLKIKIQAIRSSQTLIAFDCNDFNQTRSTIVIVDHNLNVISRKEFNFFSLIGSSELNLFCMNHKKEAKCLLLDWSLNELERKIEFQRVDSKEPFYLFNYEVFHLNGKPVLLQLENIRDRLIVRTNAYHLENKCILIYSKTNGMLLEKIKLDSNNSSNFKIDRQHELVCVLCQNNSLISLYNLDGLILEQI